MSDVLCMTIDNFVSYELDRKIFDYFVPPEKNIFIMLSGLPGSGKTTARSHIFTSSRHNFFPISSDDYIEEYAKFHNITYSEAFSKCCKAAEQRVYEEIKLFTKDKRNIVWDQTNISPKVRTKKLSLIPKNYYRISIHMDLFSVIVKDNNISRRNFGRDIPDYVMKSMEFNQVKPTQDENFDMLITATNYK